MRIGDKARRGQALVMVTLVLFAMLGMIGLVVDLGWAYYIRKSAQAAADAAAMAAVQQVNINGPYSCGTGSGFTCQAMTTCANPVPTTPTTNVDSGCSYASRNGFLNGGLQSVTMQSNASPHPDWLPNINAHYWVTARVSQGIPQLFSSILGHTTGTSSARATAAIVDQVVPGSLYALNREYDPDPNVELGTDIDAGGGGSITMGSGMYMSSTLNGSPDGEYAAESNGSYSITAPFANFRGTGSTNSNMFANGGTPVTNGYADGSNFMDPMRGKGQPPAPQLNPNDQSYNHKVPGGNWSDCSRPLPQGYYYATDMFGTTATGGAVTFSCDPTFGSSTGFGYYVFFGGVNFGGNPTLGPGEYIFAGALSGNTILNQGNQTTLGDTFPYASNGGTGAVTWTASNQSNNAGEILIFTNGTYPGLQVPTLVQNIQPNLTFGNTDIQMGNKNEMILHGLNSFSSDLPDSFKTFAPTIFWQDQRNSTVKYTADGNIDYTSCGAGHTLDNPCPNTQSGTNPDIWLQAHPMLHMYGVFYQPRGASITFQGHGGIDAPMQFITGSLEMQGGPTIILSTPTDPLTRRVAALVE